MHFLIPDHCVCVCVCVCARVQSRTEKDHPGLKPHLGAHVSGSLTRNGHERNGGGAEPAGHVARSSEPADGEDPGEDGQHGAHYDSDLELPSHAWEQSSRDTDQEYCTCASPTTHVPLLRMLPCFSCTDGKVV